MIIKSVMKPLGSTFSKYLPSMQASIAAPQAVRSINNLQRYAQALEEVSLGFSGKTEQETKLASQRNALRKYTNQAEPYKVRNLHKFNHYLSAYSQALLEERLHEIRSNSLLGVKTGNSKSKKSSSRKAFGNLIHNDKSQRSHPDEITGGKSFAKNDYNSYIEQSLVSGLSHTGLHGGVKQSFKQLFSTLACLNKPSMILNEIAQFCSDEKIEIAIVVNALQRALAKQDPMISSLGTRLVILEMRRYMFAINNIKQIISKSAILLNDLYPSENNPEAENNAINLTKDIFTLMEGGGSERDWVSLSYSLGITDDLRRKKFLKKLAETVNGFHDDFWPNKHTKRSGINNLGLVVPRYLSPNEHISAYQGLSATRIHDKL